MKIFKLILFVFTIFTCFQNYSYSFEIVKIKSESEYNEIYSKAFKGKDIKNSIYINSYYIKDKEKNGIFLIKDVQFFVKLKSIYIANYDSPLDPFKIEKVRHIFCELFIYYDNNTNSKIWQSQFPCDGDSSVNFLTVKFNAKSYDIAVVETRNAYIYPRPDCTSVENCQNDQPVHRVSTKVVIIYDPASDNWIDSKYLEDERINYLASVNGKTPLKKFSEILTKQIKDLKIDLGDISPVAQTCYFLEPLEPCYKNLKLQDY